MGLEYLTLERSAPTLSNGEAQRIRLARQLGSHLNGVLYVLDEPTIGLHPHDNNRLNQALHRLIDLGNTLLIVEHDPQTIATADWIIDFGPGAGIHGGHITAQGTYDQILHNHHSLTGAYLSGREKIEIPKHRRKPRENLTIAGANQNNLKNLTVELPLGVLTCLTGISGSGNSTLLHKVIKPTVEKLLPTLDPFDKMIIIDQNPIGHTVRSDVGTYVELLPVIREFYASLAAARVRDSNPAILVTITEKGCVPIVGGLAIKRWRCSFSLR